MKHGVIYERVQNKEIMMKVTLLLHLRPLPESRV